MDKFAFSRFQEKRNYSSKDTTGYDEYVEGVEPDETASLERHIGESNMGYKLVQKMGWKSGRGLGRDGQGRREPIPFELKDDNMGLGRWMFEVEQAQETTDKRNQLETEKEITSDLVEKYKTQVEKEEKLAETLYEMNKSFYCELCDKQYFKYSEYDNHLNSYDHHHRQRLRDLKQWESGRRFGGQKEVDSKEDKKEKLHASYKMAVEKEHMMRRRMKKKTTPGFKPITVDEGEASQQQHTTMLSAATHRGMRGGGVKRSSEDVEKAVVKKSRVTKYGSLKFQSAGNLVTVGDRMRMDESGCGYQDSRKGERETLSQSTSRLDSREKTSPTRAEDWLGPEGSRSEGSAEGEGSLEDEGAKFSFGFSRNRKLQYKPRGCAPPKEEKTTEKKKEGGDDPCPPPLMSRQRELMTKAFGGDSDSEGEGDGAELVKMASRVRGTPKFMFQIRK